MKVLKSWLANNETSHYEWLFVMLIILLFVCNSPHASLLGLFFAKNLLQALCADVVL